MRLFIITGPQAVGKMSVGFKLSEKTGMSLFHNHMTIELVKSIYGDLTSDSKKLITKLREDIFEAVSESDLKGLIFTYLWGFNLQNDHDYINNLIKKYEDSNWETYIVELEADIEIRKERNKTELRLEHKPSKRDLEWSENELVSSMDKYRLNSNEGEINHKNYIRINNSSLTESEVVDIIIKEFNL